MWAPALRPLPRCGRLREGGGRDGRAHLDEAYYSPWTEWLA